MRFQQVNVFSKNSLLGNPVAVIHSDKELSDERMQQMAKWTNLSETTFVFPAKTEGADYLCKIWTPWGELPFAGHPTLGTASTVLKGDQTSIVQECGAGLIKIVRKDGKLYFTGPTVVRKPLGSEDYSKLLEQLDLKPEQVVDKAYLCNGPDFHVLQLDSYESVVKCDPSQLITDSFRVVGLCAIHNGELEVRALVNSQVEDPITGSLNACLADWLIGEGKLPSSYTAHQGRCIGRDGEISVVTLDGKIWIGGETQTVFSGEANF